jgi:hypothetical protein
VGWNVQDEQWVSWVKCQMTKEDAARLEAYKAGAAQPLAKHQDDVRRGLRKPMPPPTKVHKDTRTPSRSKAKQDAKRQAR